MYPLASRRSVQIPALILALVAAAPWRAPAFAQAVAAPAPAPAAAEPPVSGLDPLDTSTPLPDLAPLPELGVAWPDLAQPDASGPVAAAPDDPVRERRYRFAIEGLDPLGPAIRQRFDALSTLKAADGKPANTAQLDRRAREDEALLRQLLVNNGYYEATVATAVAADAAGLVVTLTVVPGPAYTLSAVALDGLDRAGAKAPALARAFGVGAGERVDADRIVAGQAALVAALGHEGFPFAKVGEPVLTVNAESDTVALALPVDPGGTARFGRLTIDARDGAAPVFTTRHLGEIARFKAGDPYDAAMLEDFRRALIQTGLISVVRLTPTPAPDGRVDVAVLLEPAPKRTVAGELGYGTGEGVRAELSWQHRDLLGPEGAVTFRGVAGTREQLLGASLRRNNSGARDRVLTGQVVASHTDLQAYEARTFTLAAGIERQSNIIWQKTWTWSISGEIVASSERDSDVATGDVMRRTFFIAAVPTRLAYDGSNDLLDPTRGWRLSGRLSPEVSLQSGAFAYARAQVDGSAYVPLGRRVTIAGRVRVGGIAGAARERIAPSRRFYSGGGGSVRGYGYQRIGPRDADDDPVGGRSLAEFALEARVRFGDFGVVPFIDGGNLYSDALPRFTGLRYGAGLGVRYHTSFGPIRVDVGTPLDRRSGDSRVAVYVSLGQAF